MLADSPTTSSSRICGHRLLATSFRRQPLQHSSRRAKTRFSKRWARASWTWRVWRLGIKTQSIRSSLVSWTIRSMLHSRAIEWTWISGRRIGTTLTQTFASTCSTQTAWRSTTPNLLTLGLRPRPAERSQVVATAAWWRTLRHKCFRPKIC